MLQKFESQEFMAQGERVVVGVNLKEPASSMARLSGSTGQWSSGYATAKLSIINTVMTPLSQRLRRRKAEAVD